MNSLLGASGILPETGLPGAMVRMRVRRHPDRRRTCKAMSWWRQRRVNSLNFTQNLTSDNKTFLSDAVAEHYKPVVSSNSPLKEPPWERGKWNENERSVRTGVLAIKLGCCTQWTTNGERIVTTMLQVLDNHVIGYIPPEEFAKSPRYKNRHWGEGYGCQIVGALSCDPHMFNPSYLDLFKESGVPPKRKLTRFLVTPNAAVQPGTPLMAAHFRPGDFVNVQAKTIGHGFQGVMKRWGMSGGNATHGTTKSHRRIGSLAGPSMWGHVWKGIRMPGHMGVQWRTQKGLKVWRVNTAYNVIYVQGQAVPGPIHSYVRIMDSSFWKHYSQIDKKNPPPFPTYFHGEGEELPEDMYDQKLFQFDQDTIEFKVDPNEERKQRMLMAKMRGKVSKGRKK